MSTNKNQNYILLIQIEKIIQKNFFSRSINIIRLFNDSEKQFYFLILEIKEKFFITLSSVDL